MKILIIIVGLFMVGCSTINMNLCKDVCGLNGVKSYEGKVNRCVCDSIMKTKATGQYGYENQSHLGEK